MSATPTTNPFGQTTPPRPSGDPDAVACPGCGFEVTPNFIPGQPAIHEQARGPLGTLLRSTCTTKVIL